MKIQRSTLAARLLLIASIGLIGPPLFGQIQLDGPWPERRSAARSGAEEKVFSVTGLEVPELAAVDATMKTFVETNDVPAAAVAITKAGRLVFARGYTYAPAGATLVQPTSLFRIASCSKPLTSVAIHRLIERGELARDFRVADLLDLETRPKNFRDLRLDSITVDHLLTHSGGWDRALTYDPLFYDAVIAAALGVPLPISKHDIRVFMNGESLQFDPGARFAYSNYGLSLLGQVLETKHGRPFPAIIRDEVLLPLGLSRPRIGHSTEDEAFPGEVGYDDSLAYDFVNMETAEAPGGWILAAPDYARLLTIFDADGAPLLAPTTVDAMLEQRFSFGDLGILRGWLSWQAPGGVKAYGHNGSLPGTTTNAFWREDGIGVVIFLAKSTGGYPAVHQRVAAVTTWPEHDLWASVGIGANPAHETSEQWIPVATRADGAFGSHWESAVTILNRSPLANDVRLRWLDTERRETRLSLAPGETRSIDDLVGNLGGDGSAPLRIDAAEVFSVGSRVANRSDDGTFGQELPSFAPNESLDRGESGWLIGLRDDENFRSNLGIVNAGRRAARISVTFHAESGAFLAELPWFDLPPASLVASLLPIALLGVATASARVEVLFGEDVTAYASVIDNRTNDPTTVPLLVGSGATSQSVAVAVRADGAAGSRWRTDLVLCAPTGAEVQLRLGAAEPQSVAVPEYGQVLIEDVAARFGETSKAPLSISADRSILAAARIYDDGTTGTRGQSIPVQSERLVTEDTVAIAGVRHDAAFRTNLGVSAPGPSAACARIAIADADGARLGQVDVNVPAGEVRDVSLGEILGAAELAVGSATVTVCDGEALVWGSMIDWLTNDPTTLPARR